MPEERAARLQDLPGWRWTADRGTGRANVAKWEAQYLALKAFLGESGGRYPSQRAAVPVRPSAASYPGTLATRTSQ